MSTSSSKLQSTPSIIIALELLGLDGSDVPEQRELSALAAVSEFFGGGQEAPDVKLRRGRHLRVTGRRIVRVAPTQAGANVLFRELLDLVHLHLVLAWDHVLVRGAVVLGDASVHLDVMGGRGVLAAEQLRDTVADFPRVIVDPGLLHAVEREPNLRAAHHSVRDELDYLRSLLCLDADGMWFVDYLRAGASEVDGAPQYNLVLELHANIIRHGLAALSRLDLTYRRWTWLLGYHNRVVSEHAQQTGTKPSPDQLISSSGPLFFTFPRSTAPR
jgi:hypothetical protein